VNILFRRIQSLERLWSRFEPTSEIARLNREGSVAPQAVSSETHIALDLAETYRQQTQGAFNPRLHGYDLGALGKGLALDWAWNDLRAYAPACQVRMNFGGQLFFGEPCPPPAHDIVLDIPGWMGDPPRIRVPGHGSVSTTSQGERPGHVRDPQTGHPADACRSVTVWAACAADADVWSTALFVRPTLGAIAPVDSWIVPCGGEDRILEYKPQTSSSSQPRSILD